MLILFNKMPISTQRDNLCGVQLKYLVQGQVVRGLVNANTGLKVNQSIDLSGKKGLSMFVTSKDKSI